MKILGTTSTYHKFVFEVRYQHGLVYLDRCGTTMNRILKHDTNWVQKGDNVSPQGAPLINVLSGTQLTFGTQKYDFSMDQPVGKEAALTRHDIDSFVADVSAVSPLVHEELTLTQFLRKGFRIWYVFAATSEDESFAWIKKLKPLNTDPAIGTSLGGSIESTAYTLVVRAPDRKLRVSINPVERLETLDLGTADLRTLPRYLSKDQRGALLKQLAAKRRVMVNPEFAVMIDVDVFVEDPIEIEGPDFIRESLDLVEQKLPQALEGAKR